MILFTAIKVDLCSKVFGDLHILIFKGALSGFIAKLDISGFGSRKPEIVGNNNLISLYFIIKLIKVIKYLPVIVLNIIF